MSDTLPEATLKQLGLEDAAFSDDFIPSYIAMNEGLGQPGGVWYIHELFPMYNPHSGEWESNGYTWEVGGDCTDGLIDTPMFQRFIRAECSLMKIVEETKGDPTYPEDAYIQRAIED